MTREEIIAERKVKVCAYDLVEQAFASKNCADDAIDKYILAEEIVNLIKLTQKQYIGRL